MAKIKRWLEDNIDNLSDEFLRFTMGFTPDEIEFMREAFSSSSKAES